MSKYANFPTPGEIQRYKKRKTKRFKIKFLLTHLFLWLLQIGTMFGAIYLFGWIYYDTGEIPALIVSILLFWLSIKSYAYRVDYKKSFGYRVKNAMDDNPINDLNRKKRRAIQFNKRRRN